MKKISFSIYYKQVTVLKKPFAYITQIFASEFSPETP